MEELEPFTFQGIPVPMLAIHLSIQTKMAMLLDLPSLDSGWTHLAEKLGFPPPQIQWISQLRTPIGSSTLKMFEQFQTMPNSSVDDLLAALQKLGRKDVIQIILDKREDICNTFSGMIQSDFMHRAKQYKQPQQDELSQTAAIQLDSRSSAFNPSLRCLPESRLHSQGQQEGHWSSAPGLAKHVTATSRNQHPFAGASPSIPGRHELSQPDKSRPLPMEVGSCPTGTPLESFKRLKVRDESPECDPRRTPSRHATDGSNREDSGTASSERLTALVSGPSHKRSAIPQNMRSKKSLSSRQHSSNFDKPEDSQMYFLTSGNSGTSNTGHLTSFNNTSDSGGFSQGVYSPNTAEITYEESMPADFVQTCTMGAYGLPAYQAMQNSSVHHPQIEPQGSFMPGPYLPNQFSSYGVPTGQAPYGQPQGQMPYMAAGNTQPHAAYNEAYPNPGAAEYPKDHLSVVVRTVDGGTRPGFPQLRAPHPVPLARVLVENATHPQAMEYQPNVPDRINSSMCAEVDTQPSNYAESLGQMNSNDKVSAWLRCSGEGPGETGVSPGNRGSPQGAAVTRGGQGYLSASYGPEMVPRGLPPSVIQAEMQNRHAPMEVTDEPQQKHVQKKAVAPSSQRAKVNESNSQSRKGDKLRNSQKTEAKKGNDQLTSLPVCVHAGTCHVQRQQELMKNRAKTFPRSKLEVSIESPDGGKCRCQATLPVSELVNHGHSSNPIMQQGEFEQTKRKVRVFVTYAKEGRSNSHVKKVVGLGQCLRKNGFSVTLDELEKQWTNERSDWVTTRFKKAHFILVVVSSKYQQEVEVEELALQQEAITVDRGDANTRPNCNTTRLIYRLMLREYQGRQSNKRFVPILFPNVHRRCIPQWLATDVVYRWPDQYKDVFYYLLQPEVQVMQFVEDRRCDSDTGATIKTIVAGDPKHYSSKDHLKSI